MRCTLSRGWIRENVRHYEVLVSTTSLSVLTALPFNRVSAVSVPKVLKMVSVLATSCQCNACNNVIRQRISYCDKTNIIFENF